METTFSNASDVCQLLLDRYSKSSAQQHRHLCATAAATRSLIHSESLPLTPFSYFAAAISTISDQNPRLDPHAIAALSSFLTIVLPLVPGHAITRDKAREAVEVVAGKINGDVTEAFLGTATVRALIKSVEALLGFCDIEDWDSIKLGFSLLLSFSIDKRPKVRKCAQDCLVALFKSLGSSGVMKQDDADWSRVGVKEVVKAPEKGPIFAEDMPEEALVVNVGHSAGLHNLGNACYMNSTVQCLHSVPELKSALIQYPPSVSGDLDQSSHLLTAATRDLFNNLDKSVKPVVEACI